MKIGPYQLTYCTNIHPGESWDEVRDALASVLLSIRARVAGEAPFGVGLRLSAAAAETLAQPRELAAFRGFLAAHGLYVFTINGFPYGAFHGAAVKERVYRPDWLEEERGAYTTRLGELLEALLPDDPALFGSISTVPAAYRPRVRGPSEVERLVGNLVRQAAVLHRLGQRRGRQIVLALEPEPCCYLETGAETVRFFEEHLFGPSAMARFASLTGLTGAAAEEALRRHLGVCLDACHIAVQFESPARVLERLHTAGIRVPKIQLSAGIAVRISPGQEDGRRALRRFAESVYLHQVVVQPAAGGGLRRYPDLQPALEAAPDGTEASWRVHFHVPLFCRDLGVFETTQAEVEALLASLAGRRAEEPPHLEVETYSWHLLPPADRSADVVTDVSRELEWVLERLSPGRDQQ